MRLIGLFLTLGFLAFQVIGAPTPGKRGFTSSFLSLFSPTPGDYIPPTPEQVRLWREDVKARWQANLSHYLEVKDDLKPPQDSEVRMALGQFVVESNNVRRKMKLMDRPRDPLEEQYKQMMEDFWLLRKEDVFALDWYNKRIGKALEPPQARGEELQDHGCLSWTCGFKAWKR